MRNKKASIELSMNFMIMLILSIVVFGLGLYFLGVIIMGLPTDPTPEEPLIHCTPQNACLDKGIVEIPLRESASPEFHIYNIKDEKQYFSYDVECYQVEDHKKNIICNEREGDNCNFESWFIKTYPLDIGMKSDRDKTLFINVPADVDKGRYYFKIQFFISDKDGNKIEDYDTPVKLKVDVI